MAGGHLNFVEKMSRQRGLLQMRETHPLRNGLRFRVNTAILTVGLAVAQLLAVVTDVVQAQDVTQAQKESGKYQAHQAWLRRIVTLEAITGQHDTLAEYAVKCKDATGIDVPGFSCGNGTEVPGQGNVPTTGRNTTHCDRPNVLNRECDPGSKFQVLSGGNADAVAVAHCRKVGLPKDSDVYNDIAVIQYNKKNGALCFYQALGNALGTLPGQDIPPPSAGDTAKWKDGKAHWISPQGTEAIGCTGCHDNGGFIRSEYLAQLNTPPNVLPNTSTGFDNLDTPARYVGLDYATNRSWSVTAPAAPDDTGSPCTACHRLAVPNRMAFGIINGTAAHFANVATAATQDSKNPHGPSSPIWMRPGQVVYKPEAEASATKFHDCAVGFFESGFVSPPPGCVFSPLGEPWKSEDLTPINYLLLDEAHNKDLTSIYYLTL
jgi:hypothetical protein